MFTNVCSDKIAEKVGCVFDKQCKTIEKGIEDIKANREKRQILIAEHKAGLAKLEAEVDKDNKNIDILNGKLSTLRTLV